MTFAGINQLEVGKSYIHMYQMYFANKSDLARLDIAVHDCR